MYGKRTRCQVVPPKVEPEPLLTECLTMLKRIRLESNFYGGGVDGEIPDPIEKEIDELINRIARAGE